MTGNHGVFGYEDFVPGVGEMHAQEFTHELRAFQHQDRPVHRRLGLGVPQVFENNLERSITFGALYAAGVRVSQQSAISRKGDAISHTALHRLAATLREVPDTRQTLLRKAAALVGREELAAGLKVAPVLLDAWMNGQATVPDRKLAALADLLDDISNPPKR